MSLSSRFATTAVLCCLLAVPTWAQTGSLRGTVTDSEGNALSGVLISVTSEQQSSYSKKLTSGKRGDFLLRFQPNQYQYSFQLLFEKTGFQSFTIPFSPLPKAIRETYIMERGETKVVESHGDLGAVVTGASSEAVEAFNAGLKAQRDGNLSEAAARLREALVADADLGPAHLSLAQVELDQQNYESALASADKALMLNTGRPEALRVKYQSLVALGNKAEAEVVAGQLAEADDASAAARLLYNEGGVAFQAGDKAMALAKFEEAARLDASLIDAHHAIATLQLANGNHEASAEAAEKALAMGSDDMRTLRVLYDAYDSLGRTEELVEIAPRLAAVDPDFGGPKLLEQAAALWNLGNTEKAVAVSELALSMDSTLAKAYYFIGLNHLSKSEGDKARAALQKFIDMAPEDPEVATVREMMTYIE